MQPFINRHTELEFLETEYARSDSSLVILYGRRRIGKTALAAKFGEHKNMLYFLATEESETENRNQFKNLVGDFTRNQLLKNADVDTWYIIFDELLKFRTDRKLIVVLDEFQYLGKSNRAFPSVFQKIWDSKLKDANIMVILCGSLISLMESQTLAYSSPLYGRRTGQIKLKQIPFRFYDEFFAHKSQKELVELYSMTGGVPKYIEIFRDTTDIFEAIAHNVLTTQSLLYEEPWFLLQNEVSEIGSYFSLLKAVAMGHSKQGKIASVMEIKQTSLPKYLKTLIDLDILRRDVPVTEDSPEKSKKGLYRITDHFLAFWFQFIYPNRSFIETGRADVVMEKIRQSLVERHTAYVYEEICRESVWNLIADSKLPKGINRVGRWWDKNTEIDIVAFDSEGKDIVFGECKYTNDPMDVDIYYKLREKAMGVEWNRQGRREKYIFFSINGYTDRMTELAGQEGLLLQIADIPDKVSNLQMRSVNKK
ncbi:MAG: ATP-binding protein [Peptococcaceae bacterium]|nr:ATP-binding protein [Peptococcaceae bacterium]